MKYFTNLFTHKTWQEFKVQGGTISGQSEHRHVRCSKMQPGDRLLCYLVGASRWIGVLEVTAAPYLDFDEKNRIWKDNLWPSRIPVKIILECKPEIAPDVKPEIYEYSVMASSLIQSTSMFLITRIIECISPRFSCYLVAPDSREVEVFNQVNRPVFTKMKKPFRDSCRFIPFSSLTELGPDDFISFKHQKISYIEEEFSESLVPSDV